MPALLLRAAVVLTAVIAAASACSSPEAEPGAAASDTASGAATPGPTASGPTASGPTASGTPSSGTGGTLPADLRTRPAVTAAIADAATRANVAPEEVLIAAWSPVTWNDGSLGCPQKGMAYTQALVEGELLMLRVEQALFQYHSAQGGPFTYCAAPDANYSVTG